MREQFGTLTLLSATEHLDLVAPSVAKALSQLPEPEAVKVAEIDPTLSDTAAFCETYDIGMGQAANCVILEAKRGDRTWCATCVVLGNTRADINGLARRTLDARKVSFTTMEEAVGETGMEYGAITPIGLPIDWPVLIDRAVAESPLVIIGSGLRNSKLAVAGKMLANLPNAQVIDGLGKIKEK